jgi:hypothetical protein
MRDKGSGIINPKSVNPKSCLVRCLVVFLFGGSLRIKTPLFTSGNKGVRASAVLTETHGSGTSA